MPPQLQNPLQTPPTDPAYVRFLEGLRQVVGDPVGKDSWRWHPKDAKWYTYAFTDWILDDLRLPDTPPENALSPDFSAGLNWADLTGTKRPQFTRRLQEYWVPDLFARVQKAYSKFQLTHPGLNLVWSPSGGGDWRNAIKRAASLPPNSTTPGTLPPECVRRIEEVREYQRRGYVSNDVAQKLIEAIVAECT